LFITFDLFTIIFLTDIMSGNRSYLLSGAIRFCLVAVLSINLAAKNGSAQTVVVVGGEIESQE